jgi:iron complex transport system substrate-binding protein
MFGVLFFVVLAALFSFDRDAFAIEEIDDLQAVVALDAPAQRIVSLAPSNTEILFALGMGKRVVGVTEYCNFPPAAGQITKVASYNSVNLELIAAARPDLVLAIRGNDAEGLEGIRKMGIPVFALEIQTVDQVFAALERVGRLTGTEKHAKSMADSLRLQVKRIVARQDSAPLTVLWGHLSDPIYTAGKETFIDDVLLLAGAENLGRRAPGAWPQVSLETLVGWQPHVIVTTDGRAAEGLDSEITRLRDTDGWKALPAVAQGNILFVDGDLLLRPGPRVVQALDKVSAYLDSLGQ